MEIMRFLVTWELRSGGSEADQARILSLFGAWDPPIELHEWCGFSDGMGGMCIIDTDDANMVGRVTAPWTPWLDFTIRPIRPIQDAAADLGEALEFRAGVK